MVATGARRSGRLAETQVSVEYERRKHDGDGHEDSPPPGTGYCWPIARACICRFRFARLARSQHMHWQTVTLNVETDDSTAGEPDFSVLLNDFNSLGSQSSRQISMTNGSTSAKTVWAIGLEPKLAGTLVIPGFVIGAATTQPLTLTVLPAPTGPQGSVGDDIFIDVAAQRLDPYVQEQIRYS